MTTRVFHRLYPPAQPAEGPAHWLLFHGADVLAQIDQPPSLLPGATAGLAGIDVGAALLLGNFGQTPVLVGALPADREVPDGMRALNLRAALMIADAEFAGLAGYAAQLLGWMRTIRFCPACATALIANDGWGKVCPNCRHSMYPPVSPAAIVLIHDGDRVLLTTKPGWGARYSLVAGFVEPGETLEGCVAREVLEEVGVEVADIRYVGSQPWPFPHQLMVGFMARYTGGEIAIDVSELAGAAWFKRSALPDLPPPFSIARQIIERWRADGA